jgi:hypothetical protein
MNMSKVGKFESLKIVNELDRALIDLYGINMTDARITRYEALASYEENGCAIKAAEMLGKKRGIARVAGDQLQHS